jgi:hypothetical protein
MKESRLQRNIRAALELQFPGSVWFKYHGGPFTRAGVPDLLGVVYGRFIALEVKRPGERASRIQRHVQKRLANAGAIVGVVTSVDEALTQIKAGFKARREAEGFER